MKNKTGLKGPLLLLLCSLFWGTTFSAQSNAMRYIGPFTFVFMRSTVTFLILLIARPFLNKLSGTTQKPDIGKHIRIGSIIGLALVTATMLQQIGIMTTTAAKSGFITALYLIIVPLFGLFMHKKPSLMVWIALPVSLVGLYLLCLKPGDMSLNRGDLYTLGCAVVFSIHIVIVDTFGNDLDSVLLSTIQFGTTALVSGIIMLFAETPSLNGILSCWTSIAYAAIFSGAIGYTLQIVGQKHTEPTLASMIMCLESVFAAIGGWIILREALSGREILGCALMLGASLLALAPSKKKRS